MTRWTVAKPLNPPKGITADILEDGNGQWKRTDAFGHCTDQWVHEYKMARRDRPAYEAYARECDKNPPEFDEDGGLI